MKIFNNKTAQAYSSTCFSLDLRAIAWFRIIFASMIITDLISRARNLTAHYTDYGVLPRSYVVSNFLGEGSWSIHLFGGSNFFQILLFIISGTCALSLLVGYKTRFSSILTWFLLVSLQNRNPLILHGGDVIFLLLSFWAMFLPLGAVYSVDKILAQAPTPKNHKFISTGTIAVTIQMCIIYWFAAILKTDPVWHTEGTAVYYALNVESIARPISQYLLNFPEIMKFLSFSTLYFEFFGPFLLFVPIYNSIFRIIAILGFIGLHAGFAIFIQLGLFPFIAITGWILFTPALIHNYLEKFLSTNKIKNLVTNIFNNQNSQNIEKHKNYYFSNFTLPKWSNFAAIFAIIYVLLWNIRTLDYEKFDQIYPFYFDSFGIVTGLEQEWALFAPKPLTDDGWYVIPATFSDGSELDLHSKKSVNWEKPKNISESYDSMRWSKFYIELWHPESEEHLKFYSEYLCIFWNEQKNTSKKLDNFSIYFMHEPTLANYEQAIIEPMHLWEHSCGDSELAEN